MAFSSNVSSVRMFSSWRASLTVSIFHIRALALRKSCSSRCKGVIDCRRSPREYPAALKNLSIRFEVGSKNLQLMYSVAVVFARLLSKTRVAKSDELALTEGKTAVQLLRDWHSSFSLIVKFASFSSKILTTPFSKIGLAIIEAFGARYFMSMSNSGTI